MIRFAVVEEWPPSNPYFHKGQWRQDHPKPRSCWLGMDGIRNFAHFSSRDIAESHAGLQRILNLPATYCIVQVNIIDLSGQDCGWIESTAEELSILT